MGMEKEARRGARAVLKLFDSHKGVVESRLANARQKGEKVSCQKGCAHCCYQYAVVGFLEAVAMVDHIRQNWKQEDIDKLKERIEVGVQNMPTTITRSDYFKQQFPCVLLDDKTKDCMAYEARPGACRYYFVSSDPYNCSLESGSGAPVRVIQFKDIELATLQTMVKESRERNIPLCIAPLPIALWWAFLLLEKGAKEFERLAKDELYARRSLLLWTRICTSLDQWEKSVREGTVNIGKDWR